MLTGVGMTGLGVAVNVARGVAVQVAVGEGVNVAAGVGTNGMAMMPDALPQRS